MFNFTHASLTFAVILSRVKKSELRNTERLRARIARDWRLKSAPTLQARARASALTVFPVEFKCSIGNSPPLSFSPSTFPPSLSLSSPPLILSLCYQPTTCFYHRHTFSSAVLYYPISLSLSLSSLPSPSTVTSDLYCTHTLLPTILRSAINHPY